MGDVVLEPAGETSRDLPQAVEVVRVRDELGFVAEVLQCELDAIAPDSVPDAPDMGQT